MEATFTTAPPPAARISGDDRRGHHRRPLDVDAQAQVPVRRGRVLGPGQEARRAVDQPAHRPADRARRLGGPAAVGLPRNVAGHDRRGAQLGGRLARQRLVAVDEDGVGARLDEGGGRRPADTRRTTRDDRDRSGDVGHRRTS